MPNEDVPITDTRCNNCLHLRQYTCPNKNTIITKVYSKEFAVSCVHFVPKGGSP